jgi:CubicO group peptidase (beta-lactamase class C family)
MRQLARLAVVYSVFLAAAGCAALQPAPPDSVGLSGERLKALSGAVQAKVDKREIPGAVVLIARRDKVAYFEAFGYRDREAGAPMTRDAIFRIASMTKPIVTVAALMQVEEGKLRLSDPVSRYLPEFKGVQVGLERKDASGATSLELVPAQREVTVLDLMRHTSGLTYDFTGKSMVRERYAQLKVRDPAQNNAQFVAKVAQAPLQNQPGTVWDYSFSTEVLGRLVEVLDGQDLEEVLARRILRPLGMGDTGFWISDSSNYARIAETQADPATGKRPALPDKTVRSWQSGGGAMVSTAADYARFCQMLLNGGELQGVRILQRESVAQMTQDQLPPGIASNSSGIPVIDVRQESGHGFGLGLMVRTADGRSPIRGSVGDYTWSGLFGTYFWIDPRQELFGIILMQSPAAAYRSTAAHWVELRNLVYDALAN